MNRPARSLGILPLALLLACSSGGPTGPNGDGDPVPPRDTVLLNVTFCTPDGTTLRADIHFPAGDPQTRVPALAFFHGGAWVFGTEDAGRWFEQMLPRLLARGFVVATFEYRLSPDFRWSAHIEDAKCAIRFLRANATGYGIDPARIGAWGSSAGGHLAALLGTTDASAGFEGDGGHAGFSSSVSAVVDLYGPADLTTGDWPLGSPFLFQLVFGTSDPESPILVQASPVTHGSAGDAPFLILHGDSDGILSVQQSIALADALEAAGVDVTLTIVENGKHGLVGQDLDPTTEEIEAMIEAFFVEKVR